MKRKRDSMKKVVLILIVFIIVFGAVACSKHDRDSNVNEEKTTVSNNNEENIGENSTENKSEKIEPINAFGYVYDGELYLYNDGATRKITRAMKSHDNSFNNKFVIAKDYNKMFYYDFYHENTHTCTLCIMDLTTGASITVADRVSEFKVNTSGNLVYFLANNTLGVYDFATDTIISENVISFDLTDNGNKVIYKTVAGELFIYTNNGDLKLISSNVRYYRYSRDLDVIAYTVDDVLYYKKGNDIPVELCKIKGDKFYLTDSKSLYYVKQEDILLSKFILDDMQGVDNQLLREIRNTISTETFKQYSLCYYVDGQKKLLSDWVMDLDGIVDVEPLDLANNILSFSFIGNQEIPKLNISELNVSTTSGIRRSIRSRLTNTDYGMKIVVNGNVYEPFDNDSVVQLGYNKGESKLYYFIMSDNLKYELYSQDITNGKLQNLTKIDCEAPSGILIADGKTFYATFSKIDKYYLYNINCNDEKIISDVQTSSSAGRKMLLNNIKVLNGRILVSEWGGIDENDNVIDNKLKYYTNGDMVLIADKALILNPLNMYANNTILHNGYVAYLSDYYRNGDSGLLCELSIFDGENSRLLQKDVSQLIEIFVDTSNNMAYAVQNGDYMYGDLCE